MGGGDIQNSSVYSFGVLSIERSYLIWFGHIIHFYQPLALTSECLQFAIRDMPHGQSLLRLSVSYLGLGEQHPPLPPRGQRELEAVLLGRVHGAARHLVILSLF